VYCTESPFLPAWRSLSEAKYKVMVMDWFINAQRRGVCLHKILDEYFGNNECGGRVLIGVSNVTSCEHCGI
jgi:hypothetical protein